MEGFKSLKKTASKNDIYLLSGVELSVNDGANGVHCLIVFDFDTWTLNSVDFINQFLTAAFEGIANHGNENTRCNYSLKDTLGKLEEHRKKGRDSFIIMAHVNQQSGFLKEFDGGRIEEFAKDKQFRNNILGFQKFRNYEELQKLNLWFDNKIPPFVEGSDCKNLDDVGQAHTQKDVEKRCYVKIGAFSFEAVKYALIHHEERVSPNIPNTQDLYLSKVFINTATKEHNLFFNADLNTIIGVRGGGKSTLLETIRFCLGENFQNKSDNYKNEIVRRFVGEGREIEIELNDSSHNLVYKIKRTWGGEPKVFDSNGIEKMNLLPKNLIEIAYFGQKDLEEIGKDFDEKVIKEKILKQQLEDYEKNIEVSNTEVHRVIGEIKKIENFKNKKQETENLIAELTAKTEQFEKYGLTDLLKREISYGNDEQRLDNLEKVLLKIIKNIKENIEDINLDNHLTYQSEQEENQLFFKDKVYPSIEKLSTYFSSIFNNLDSTNEVFILNDFFKYKEEFTHIHSGLKSDFDKIKQNISEPDIDIEKHKKYEQELITEKENLKIINTEVDKLETFQANLKDSLNELEKCYIAEFDFIKSELEKLNNSNLSFNIQIKFEGDKQKFKTDLLNICQGSGLSDQHYKNIVDRHQNCTAIYNDLDNPDGELHRILSGGSLLGKFKKYFNKNLAQCLTYKVPDKYTFLYNGKDLLKYSIGQKATALIAFVLANARKSLFIIDQPEDDLDNHTVAKEIIQRIIDLKKTTQFIFVTHNPNILVLGDSEQIFICDYNTEDQRVTFSEIGSIDSPNIQQKAMKIMEGGRDAFERRERVYKTWKN